MLPLLAFTNRFALAGESRHRKRLCIKLLKAALFMTLEKFAVVNNAGPEGEFPT
jgi:hypothetical protein